VLFCFVICFLTVLGTDKEVPACIGQLQPGFVFFDELLATRYALVDQHLHLHSTVLGAPRFRLVR
jgi:hypothetical protein